MGRRAEGWKLRLKRTGIYHVRWQQGGARHEVSTGERDPRKAAAAAAAIYARAVSGQPSATGARSVSRLPLDELAARWLTSIRGSTHAVSTTGLYELHMGAHLIPAFETLDRITPGAIGDYQRRRLREVTRATVRKERNTLSIFLAWCREQGLIDRVEMPELPRGATGSRATTRKAHAIDVTPEQVEAFLAALPEMSAGKIRGSRRFHVRARFIVAWETGLRPSTLDRLRTPEHYVVGSRTLRIEDAIDKARFGREVPITERCARALDAVIGDRVGLIFGRHDSRDYVAAAAKAADLPTGFSPYDLRHGRALALTEASGNLPGVAFLLGHRKLTTTDRYLRGTRRAADAALAALSSGAIVGPQPQNANGAPVAESAESLESTESVRRAGLEPARCYPLAPQGTEHRENSRSSESDQPRGTANKPQATRDSGARPQNPESAEVATLRGLAKALRWAGAEFDALEGEEAAS